MNYFFKETLPLIEKKKKKNPKNNLSDILYVPQNPVELYGHLCS